MRAFRADPHLGDMFAPVCVICWPILWWQLNALLAWSRRQSVVDPLYSVNDWGFITSRNAGETPHPETRKPLARTFRPLTDASWAVMCQSSFLISPRSKRLGLFQSSPASAGELACAKRAARKGPCRQSWIHPRSSAAHPVFLRDERIQTKSTQ
ncbi:MAG: hypothetical protein GC196_06635 [Hyphomonas sp.]|nr:hypothetical protein [Hyphomonas sp.]